jgi:hypothetical protein
VIESILSYGWEILAMDNKSKKKIFAEMDFLKKSFKALNSSEQRCGYNNNFGKSEKQHVEVLWTPSMHGG